MQRNLLEDLFTLLNYLKNEIKYTLVLRYIVVLNTNQFSSKIHGGCKYHAINFAVFAASHDSFLEGAVV